MRLINEYAVKWAVEEKRADPRVVVGDTTAQEAAIPYPNEYEVAGLSSMNRSQTPREARQSFVGFSDSS